MSSGMAMTKKDRILHEAVDKNGLDKKIVKDSLLWNMITDCMQTYANEQKPEQPIVTKIEPGLGDGIYDEEFTIKESIEPVKEIPTHECSWLYCGNGIYVCSHCPAYKEKVVT